MDQLGVSYYFFLGDGVVVLDVAEDGGLHEVALVTVAFSSNQELGSVLDTLFDESQDLLHLSLVDLWAVFGLWVEGVSGLTFLGTFDGPLDEFIVDLVLDESPGAGAAHLPLVEEQTEVSGLDGMLDVHVGEDDVGALATELQSGALQVGGAGRLLDLQSDLCGTGEGDFFHLNVLTHINNLDPESVINCYVTKICLSPLRNNLLITFGYCARLWSLIVRIM